MPLPVDAALADLGRVLERLKIDWFLFGAQAAIIYGSTRVTEDIDVTINLRGQTSRQLITALKRAKFGLRVADTNAFVERTRVLPIVHEKTKLPIDLVVAGPGLEELFMSRARRIQRNRVRIPVASPEDLIVMKVLASRPHDLEDIRAILRAQATLIDTALINKTLSLLEEALGQSDLRPIFAQLQRELRPRKLRPKRRTTPKQARKRR